MNVAKSGSLPMDGCFADTLPATGSIYMLRALTHTIAQYGITPSELLEAVGLPERALTDASYRMSLAEEERLFRVVIDVTGDSAFGFSWANRTHFTAWGAMSLVLAYSPTLRQVFDAIERYAPIFSGGFAVTYHERGPQAAVRLVLSPRKAEICARIYSEVFMGGMVRLLGNHFAVCFRSASFRYSAPDDTSKYRDLFGDKLRFDARHTELVMARAPLERSKRVDASDLVVRTARNDVEGMLEEQSDCKSLAWRIRRHLAVSDLNAVDMTDAARAVGLSVRSLRRLLSEEGLSWTTMLYEERAVRAERLLAHLTIQETAFELGFADSSAFHRAFKKWTGRTPAAFQRSRRVR